MHVKQGYAKPQNPPAKQHRHFGGKMASVPRQSFSISEFLILVTGDVSSSQRALGKCFAGAEWLDLNH